MLSIEKHPSDPTPCPCQTHPQQQQLTSSSNNNRSRNRSNSSSSNSNKDTDEKVSSSSSSSTSSQKGVTTNFPEAVDLKSLPTFSIREYVLKSRSKDIQNSWPFSLKNLELCLKHGVKDVLPPFQPLDKVRNRSDKERSTEAASTEKGNTSCSRGETYTSEPEKIASLTSDDSTKLKRNPSRGENEIPSIATSVSHSEIESFPTSGKSSSVVEADTLPEASTRKKAAAPPSCKTDQSASRTVAKKCRLIVKFGSSSDRSVTEDIASNCTTVSETMTSKVCPVCKTFSSSSNTTLNAHIDQCLSMESAPKWTVDSKLTRNRIKPRKTRLMVDIYATAQRCTLEELDRRNGTNWAAVSSFPGQEAEGSAEGVKHASQVPKDADDESAVYIDANGTKVRILSKMNDTPLAPSVEGLGLKKSVKGSKGSKHISSKKKKLHAAKHQKYLKLAAKSKKNHPRKVHYLQGLGSRDKQHAELKGTEESRSRKLRSHGLLEAGKSGALQKWVCSKRTGPAKKIATREDHPPSRCELHVAPNLLVENGSSSFGNTFAPRNRLQTFSSLSENSGQDSEGIGNPSYEVQSSQEQSPGRKRMISPSFGSMSSDDMEKCLPPMKQKLHKDSNFCLDIHKSHPSISSGNNLSQQSDERQANLIADECIHSTANARSLKAIHKFTRDASRFSTLRKKVSSAFHSSMVASISKGTEKPSVFGKPKVHSVAVTQKDSAAWQSAHYEPRTEESADQFGREETEIEMLHSGSFLPENGQGGEDILHGESHEEGQNVESSIGVSDHVPEDAEQLKSTWSNVRDDDTVVERRECSKTRAPPQRLLGIYKGTLCGAEAFRGPSAMAYIDGEAFCSGDDAGNNMGERADTSVLLDIPAEQGNSFLEVDPIPIPGPPGSFLPSPGATSSEDIQGNSSLTTSRAQSSDCQQDLVDGDSSDSPISATSTVSNSNAARTDPKYSGPVVSAGPQELQDKPWSSFLTPTVEPLLKVVAPAPQATGAVMERNSREITKVNNPSVEWGPLVLRNDNQPCCCQKKERVSQAFALNHQDSQLLRRRAVASLTLPGIGKQVDQCLNAKRDPMDGRPETFTPSFCLQSAPEKPVSHPVTLNGTPERGTKFSNHVACDTASPSTPNPVLRLMGKNLMVVNKEDPSVSLMQSQSSLQNDRVFSQTSMLSGLPYAGSQQHGCHFIHQVITHGHESIGGQNSPHPAAVSFDPRSSGSFSGINNQKMTKAPGTLHAGIFPDQHMLSGFTGPIDPREYGGEYDSTIKHQMKEISDLASKQRLVKVTRNPKKHGNAGSSTNPAKEIIIIDDNPENEADQIANYPKHTEGPRDACGISPVVSFSRAASYDPREASHFTSYRPPHLVFSEMPTENPATYGSASSRQSNASPVRWNCTSEGPPQSPFIATSSSAGHLGSALHYPSSLS